MEDSYWRTWARVVAYVDLALCVIASMTVCLVFIVAALAMGTTLVGPNGKVMTINDIFADWWDYVQWVSFALVTLARFLASLELLSATEFGRNVHEALDNARFWRNVTFVFLVIDVAALTASIVTIGVTGRWHKYGNVWFLRDVCWIVWRRKFLTIVHMFMTELEAGFVPAPGSVEGGSVETRNINLVKVCVQ